MIKKLSRSRDLSPIQLQHVSMGPYDVRWRRNLLMPRVKRVQEKKEAEMALFRDEAPRRRHLRFETERVWTVCEKVMMEFGFLGRDLV